MTPTQILAGGWRWPFALGLVIVPVGFYIRSKLDDPKLFLRARASNVPARLDLRAHSIAITVGIGLSVLFVVSAYILFLYMPTFAVRQLGIPMAQGLVASGSVARCYS